MGREYRHSRHGWRMYNTSSPSGLSAMTPYCKTPIDLAIYCTRNCSAFGDEKATYLTWLNFILSDDKYIPSVCLYKGEVISGLNAAYRVHDKRKKVLRELTAKNKQYE